MHKAAACIVGILEIAEYLMPFRWVMGDYSRSDIRYAFRNVLMLDADQCFQCNKAEQETEVEA